MIDSNVIFLLVFMAFCIIGAIYCAWFKESVPIVNLDKVIIDLGYTKEQFIEDDNISDRCYAVASSLQTEVLQDYIIRRDSHYKGVRYGLIACATIGGALFLTGSKKK